jgi:choline transport protein
MSDPYVEERRKSVKLADSDTLALLGKKQVLKRRFGFWSLFGFAVCELITWETVLALFSQGFNNGGPGALVYGFIIAWSSTLSVYTVISELASIAPIAAGQYYWVYMLAPDGYKKVLSYLVGWLTSLAWIATVATETIFAGTILQGLIILDHPDSYDPKQWHGTLLAWLVVAVAIFINVVIPGALPKLEIGVIVFHLLGFVGIVAALWATAPIGTAHFVFATSLNEGGWSTQGLSYCVGFLGNVATFVGADASVHMAEEVENAALSIPRAICASMLINGCVGFVMMITTLFCLGDVTSVLETATGYPFIQIFYNAVQSRAGAVAMGAIVLALTWACSTGIITTASRMTWSFARDKGTPFSHYLSKVAPHNQIPIVAVGTVCTFACLLTLIYIGSYTAFNDVISLTITGFYGSYLLPASLLLYHRIKGHVLPHGTDPAELSDAPEESTGEKIVSHHSSEVGVAQIKLIWGPWHIPGLLGTINNAYACVYMVFVIFWSVWPPVTPVTASTMNYSVVVTGGVLILAGIWYVIRGRREYKGPLVDTDVVEVMRRSESIVSVRA